MSEDVERVRQGLKAVTERYYRDTPVLDAFKIGGSWDFLAPRVLAAIRAAMRTIPNHEQTSWESVLDAFVASLKGDSV